MGRFRRVCVFVFGGVGPFCWTVGGRYLDGRNCKLVRENRSKIGSDLDSDYCCSVDPGFSRYTQ